MNAANGGDFQISMGLFGILLFSYFTGASVFGFGSMILMNIISAACAFLFENASVSFGFPFGYFNENTARNLLISIRRGIDGLPGPHHTACKRF